MTGNKQAASNIAEQNVYQSRKNSLKSIIWPSQGNDRYSLKINILTSLIISIKSSMSTTNNILAYEVLIKMLSKNNFQNTQVKH